MDRNQDFRPRFRSPVNQGEELDVTIEAVGDKGDGVCRKKGFVIFVPNTKEGDRVRIRVTKVLKKVGFGEVIGEAKSASDDDEPARVVPPPKKQPAPQDSEDFGEEDSGDDDYSDDDQPEEDSEEEPEDEPDEDFDDEEDKK